MAGEKASFFAPFIYKMHYFTKTDSGQTWGKHSKKGRFLAVLGGVDSRPRATDAAVARRHRRGDAAAAEHRTDNVV